MKFKHYISVLVCFVLLLTNIDVVRAQSCESIFPGPVQNTSNGGYVRINWLAQVSGANSNQIYTTDLRDFGGPTNSCTSGDCIEAGSVVPVGTYAGGYPGGPDINSNWGQARSISPGNYDDFDHDGNATVTMQPGVYTFDGSFTTGNSVEFVLASPGSVAIFVRGNITLGYQSRFNNGGIDRYVFMHTPGDILIDNESRVNAILYSGDDVTIDYQAQVTGAITARDNLFLEDQTRVFYNSAQVANTDFNGFCDNGPVTPPDPIAEWHLDENTWSGAAGEIIDTSGNDLHGYSVALGGNHPLRENTDPALASDPGTCAYGNFNGVSDGYLRINDPGTNSILDLNSEFAVAVWIYPRSWATSDLMSIVSKDENFEFHLNGDGEVNWWWGGGQRELTTAAPVPINQWHHIIISYESGNQVIYVNGNVAATHNSTQAIDLNNDPVLLGTDLDFNNRNFNGYIDEVKIYDQSVSAAEAAAIMAETHPCPVGPLINGFIIDTGGITASTCVPRTVTITAVDALNNTLTDYTGTLSISTSTGNGDWSFTGTPGEALGILTPGASDSGSATYEFEATGADQGSIRLNFSNFHAETLTITVSENTNAVVSTSNSLSFSQNAFVITATDVLGDDVIAWRHHDFQIAVYRRDPGTGNCGVATNYNAGGIKIWISRTGQDPSGPGPEISPLSGTPALVLGNNKPATDFALPFVNGVANFRLLARDVGNYALVFQDDSHNYSDQDIDGSTASLVARPFGFYVNVPENAQATDENGGIFTVAGDTFEVNVRAVGWSIDDDGNGDGMPDGHADNNPGNNANLADNQFLTSYGAETPVEAVRLSAMLIAPLGLAAPGLSNSQINGNIISVFNSGVGTTSNVYYSEVGIIEIAAGINDNSYLGANLTVSARAISKSTYVGRFIPAYFAAISGNVTEACGTGLNYSYMGEAFEIDWQLDALNLLGNLTTNYHGAFTKLNGVDTGTVNYAAIDAAVPTPLGSRLQHNGAMVTWDRGSGEVNSGLTLVRNTLPDGPYAQLSIGGTATDGDGVNIPATSFDLDSNNDSTTDVVDLGQTEVRFGRLRLEDAFGPETANLPINFLTEYWNGMAWLTNVDDSCTAIALSSISYPQGTIDNAANRSVSVGGSSSTGMYASLAGAAVNFSEGDAGHYFTAPGAGSMGEIQVNIDLALYPWLRFDWNQDGDFSDSSLPTAHYTFGSYRGHDRVIYWQEILK